MNVLDQLICLLPQVAPSSAACRFQLPDSWLVTFCWYLSPLQLLFMTLLKKVTRVWQTMFQSPRLYLPLVILQLLQYSCRADAGVINIPPSNDTVNIDETAMFTCTATGFNTKWFINGMTYNTNNRTQDEYYFYESRDDTSDIDRYVHTIYLEFTATASRNNTEIECVAFTNNVRISDPVYLIVRGAPATPEVNLTAVNSSVLVVHWPIPFTWPDLNITRYEIMSNKSLDGDSTWTTTKNSLSVMAEANTPLCTVYQFSVVAHNRLGASSAGVVTGGYPRVPIVPPSSNDISADVRFLQDLTPMLLIEVMPPRVCPYQMVEYAVTLQDSKNNLRKVAQERLLYTKEPVSIIVEDEIERDHTYKIIIAMTLVGIEADQQPSPISKSVTTTVAMKPPASEGGLDTSTSPHLSMDLLVLICSVCGALLVSIIILSIIILLFWHHRRRSRSFRTSGTKSPTTPPMVANPIYEGQPLGQPLYETIDPQFRLPMPLPSTPASLGVCPSSPAENPYKNDIGPYSNCPQIMAFAPPLDEGYTIMTAVRDESKASESSHSSGSEPESSDMARYVPDPSMQCASEC